MASSTNRIWQIFSILIVILYLTIAIESKFQVPFGEFVTPPPAISKQIYYLTDYCEICEKFRPEFTRVPRPENESSSPSSSSSSPPPSSTLENDDGAGKSKPLPKDEKSLEKDGDLLPEKGDEIERKESSLPSPPPSSARKDGDLLPEKNDEIGRKESSLPSPPPSSTRKDDAKIGSLERDGSNNTDSVDTRMFHANGSTDDVVTTMMPTEETSSTLKRVPREIQEKEEPEIIMLDYEKKSFNDSDLNINGTWTWRTAFKRIRSKWIEKYDNKTAKKVENKFIAKIKEEQTPEGDLQKKVVLEFKKKIQNLTLLNNDIGGEGGEVEGEEKDIDDDIPVKEEEEKVLVKRDLKQIFLDPIAQPSIVIRKKRSTKQNSTNDADKSDEEDLVVINGIDNDDISITTLPSVILGYDEEKNSPDKEKKNATYEKCRLLIRFKNVDNDTLISLAETNQTEAVDTSMKNETIDSSPESSLKNETGSSIKETELNNKTDTVSVVKSVEDTADSIQEKVHSKNETGSSIKETELKNKTDTVSEGKSVKDTADIGIEEVPLSSKNDTNDMKKNENSDEMNKSLKSKEENIIEEKSLKNNEEKIIDEKATENKTETITMTSTMATKSADNAEQTTTVVPVITTLNPTLDSKNETVTEVPPPLPTVDNTELGFMINIRKFIGSIIDTVESDFNKTQKRMDKSKFLKNIKIFTSDPKNTEWWYQGEKMDTKNNKNDGDDKTKRSKRSIKENDFIDMIDVDDIVKLLTQKDGVDFDISNEKWILLERKIFFDDPDDDDDEELIINLFLKPKEESHTDMEQMHHQDKHLDTENIQKKLRCPAGTFDCKSDASLCIPNSLKCNGEDNCGNGHDELRSNCASSLNVFYVYNQDTPDPMSTNTDTFLGLDANTQGMFWFGTRVIFILFATCLFLYILLLLCRMCDRIRSESGSPMFIIPKGNYISISGDTIERRQWPTSSKSSSSKSGVGSKMDNHGSKIREYIYVNNNYGQPQGSTVVETNVQPKDRKNKSPSATSPTSWYNRLQQSSSSPDVTDEEYPPLYEDTIRQYGTKK